MVNDYSLELIDFLKSSSNINNSKWRIPSWLLLNKDFILKNLHSTAIINRYTIFHDIGKPFCKTIDEKGVVHFFEHEKVSFEIYSKVFNDPIVSRLILKDMDLHKMKMDNLKDYVMNNKEDIITQLIVSLAEIHANASIMGGLETESFKIKYKKLDKIGKRVIEYLSI